MHRIMPAFSWLDSSEVLSVQPVHERVQYPVSHSCDYCTPPFPSIPLGQSSGSYQYCGPLDLAINEPWALHPGNQTPNMVRVKNRSPQNLYQEPTPQHFSRTNPSTPYLHLTTTHPTLQPPNQNALLRPHHRAAMRHRTVPHTRRQRFYYQQPCRHRSPHRHFGRHCHPHGYPCAPAQQTQPPLQAQYFRHQCFC